MSSLSYLEIVRVLTKKCLIYGLVWFGMVWYSLVWSGMVWFGIIWFGMVWQGGECTMTSEFINEEISMLFCSKKFAGGWVVGGME